MHPPPASKPPAAVWGLLCIPAALYLGFHLLGRQYPAPLWGVDQLHYYPAVLAWVFAIVALVGLGLAARPCSAGAEGRAFPSVLGWATAGVFGALAWVFRVREHTLGDSVLWFHNMEALGRGAQLDSIIGLPVPGLEYIPALQTLDFLLHYGAYLIGHRLWEGTPQQAYAALACLAGVLYTRALWDIARHLGPDRQHLIVFGLLLSLGSTQLFFGYGESYTLVAAVGAWYLRYALRYLEGTSLLWPCTALLALAVALHLMAASLTLSWLYLLYRHPGRLGTLLARKDLRLWWLSAAAGALLAFYLGFYRNHHLPLWQAAEAGRFAVLSVPHFANLANQILLLSPFGLVWGLAHLLQRRPSSAPVRLCALTTAGPAALILVHNVTMGGRDWDLMAMPGLFYTAWGIGCLRTRPDASSLLPRAALAVLPLMLLHTALWIGINADADRAIARLGNLLRFGVNQPHHYQAFALGYYHLDRRADPEDAAVHLQQAVALAPTQEAGLYRNRYRRFLAETRMQLAQRHAEAGRNAQSIQLYQQVLQSPIPDAELYTRLGLAFYRLDLLPQSTQAYQKALATDPTHTDARVNLGWNFYLQNALDQAAAQYRRVLATAPNSTAHFNLALVLLKKGDHPQAEAAYAQAVAHYGPDEAIRIGAVQDLKTLTADPATAPTAHRILQQYWPP